jgi:hypothetical protein
MTDSIIDIRSLLLINKLRGVKDFLKKADSFLQRTKLHSNVGSALNSTVVPMQYKSIADKALDHAR